MLPASTEAPGVEHVNVNGKFSGLELVIPTLPNLRALWLHGHLPNNLTHVLACRAPRLRWVSLDGCYNLQRVTFDCPELSWLGVYGPRAQVRVASRCLCPLMGYGEFEYVPDTLSAMRGAAISFFRALFARVVIAPTVAATHAADASPSQPHPPFTAAPL